MDLTFFSTDGHVLYYKMYEIKINFEIKYTISQHLKTDKHQKIVKCQNDQERRKFQQLLTNQSSAKSISTGIYVNQWYLLTFR